MSVDIKVEETVEARPRTPWRLQGIYERTKGDFAAALREAERVMRRYVRIKADQEATRAAWDAAIERRKREIERLERGKERACAKYDWDLSYCLALLDGFMESFMHHLPRKASFETPAGKFQRRACRPTTEKAPEHAVLPLLQQLPPEAQQGAITLKPQVNWAWIKEHLVETEEGLVLRWIHPDTGEVVSIPAVVERETAYGRIEATPILRTVEPASPYTMKVVPAEGIRDDELETESTEATEE